MATKQTGLFGEFRKREPEARARRRDPETSREAARSVENIWESQRTILELLQRRGASTDEEIFMLVSGMSPSGARTRRSELVKMGLVRDSGQRRKLSTGRRAIVWEVV